MEKLEVLDLNDVSYEIFKNEYLLPEKPVILRGDFIKQLKCTQIQEIKEWQSQAVQKIGWYQSKISMENTPHLIREIFHKEKQWLSYREDCFRVFAQPKGHLTFFHYDGNSIHGFNLQLKGRKRWRIVSPETPLANMPFMYVAMISQDNEKEWKKKKYFEFTTEVGDMLFLPRYWQHQVESLDPVNINLNWVITPLLPRLGIKQGLREKEIVNLRVRFPIINKFFFPDSIDDYGGNKKVLNNYKKDQSSVKLLQRLLHEISNFIYLPFYLKNLKHHAKKFEKNNFNIF